MESFEDYREVDFHQYCPKCKHKDVHETEEPCNECMEDSYNLHTSKPVRWEEGGSK